jgi:hypothetical protein
MNLCDDCVNINCDLNFSVHEDIEECDDYLIDDEFMDEDEDEE